MEIAIKTGNDIHCAYTGESSTVLVRLSDGAPGSTTPGTGWLCRKALEDALRLISSLDGGGAPIARRVETLTFTQASDADLTEQRLPSVQQIDRPPPPPPPQANMEVVQNFDRELRRLISQADREEPEDGKKKGVKEIEIRELVLKHKPAFGKNGGPFMFRVLNARLGYEQERFKIMWNQKPERQVEGVEED